MKTNAILFVSADLPWPPDGGGRIASLRVLEALADGHPVDLIALADPISEPDLAYLRSMCRSVSVIPHPFTFGRHRVRQLSVAARSMLSTSPYRLLKFRNAEMSATVRSHLRHRKYQVVHHEQLGVAPLWSPTYPSTLTSQNVESQIYAFGYANASNSVRRYWSRLESAKLRPAEAHWYRTFDRTFVLSALDARLVAALGAPTPAVLTIPAEAPTRYPQPIPPSAPVLLTMGSMSWFGVEDGLMWFARQVLPLVWDKVPEARWMLVGPNASRAVRALGRDSRIEVLGYVEDVAPFINAARVALVPLRVAGGIRIKLIELLARGRPAVTTSVGAQGLDVRDGDGCFVRDDPGSFAAAIISLLSDDAEWQRVSRRGWERMAARHTRRSMKEALEAGLVEAEERHEVRFGMGG